MYYGVCFVSKGIPIAHKSYYILLLFFIFGNNLTYLLQGQYYKMKVRVVTVQRYIHVSFVRYSRSGAKLTISLRTQCTLFGLDLH